MTLDVLVGDRRVETKNEKSSFASFVLEKQLQVLVVVDVFGYSHSSKLHSPYLLACKHIFFLVKRGIDSA